MVVFTHSALVDIHDLIDGLDALLNLDHLVDLLLITAYDKPRAAVFQHIFRLVGDGVLVMPHLGTWDRWEDSSLVRVTLEAGHTYRVIVRDDDDTVNMSVFQHFADYTAGTGGRDGAFARVNIAELRVLRL